MNDLLLIEEDDSLAEALGQHLARLGWRPEAMAAQAALDRLSAGWRPGAAVIDRRSSGAALDRLITALESAGVTPVVTGEGGLPKPFRMTELTLRLPRPPSPERTAPVIGTCRYRAADRALLDGTGRVAARLTATEAALLDRLLDAGPVGVEAARLRDEVLGYRDGTETHALETHVWRLRRKLAPLGADHIETIPSGYRLLP